MKLMTILGGLLGFVVSLSFGLSQEGSWPAMLARACAGALLMGWLLRWWSHLWLRGLQESNRQHRQLARLKAEQESRTEVTNAPNPPLANTHRP